MVCENYEKDYYNLQLQLNRVEVTIHSTPPTRWKKFNHQTYVISCSLTHYYTLKSPSRENSRKLSRVSRLLSTESLPSTSRNDNLRFENFESFTYPCTTIYPSSWERRLIFKKKRYHVEENKTNKKQRVE